MSIDVIEIGDILRKAREERALSVEEAAEALYVRRFVLQAIESGDWSALPHPVYVRGYIAQYAKFLNVYEHIASILCAEEEPSGVRPPTQAGAQLSPKVKDKTERPRLRKAILASSVAVVAVLTLLLFHHGQREVPLPPEYETVSRNTSESQTWPQVNETRKLMIACQERTWVRIIIDGAEKKEVTLNPEEVVMFTAREKFDLLVGNAGGVKLFFDGKDTKFDGASGEVKRITLP